MIYRNKIESDVRRGILTLNEKGRPVLKKDKDIWVMTPEQINTIYGDVREVCDYIKYVKDFGQDQLANFISFVD
jgi:hypothetical protein